MILIDTSAWIDFFRGREPLAGAVSDLLESNEAAICGPILTELLRGARPKGRCKELLELFQGVHHLNDPAELWVGAGMMGSDAGSRGANIRTLDLLIATIALEADVAILSGDTDFSALRRAGIPLREAFSE